MADNQATPTMAPNPAETVDTVNVGPVPTVPPAPAQVQNGLYPPTGPAPAGTSQAEAVHNEQGSPDPVNGIGIEGEEVVWEATYSLRNFLGRLIAWSAITVAWLVLAIYTWGYNHNGLLVPTVISGVILAIFWVALVSRILQAKMGHYYRLTTRRLFISTGVIRRERDQMELLRVKDVFTKQTSLLERMLGLGTVVVVADEKTLPTYYLPGVADPKRVMDLVWHHARAEQDQRNVRVEGV
jgi:membrane protein YdbS with pleckstrin-like domain